MKRIFLPSLMLLGALLLFNSCKKEAQDTETTSATDNTICESEFMRVMPNVNHFGISEPGVQRLANGGGQEVLWNAGCATVTISQANQFPVTMTVDYGTTGCVDSVDGKTRTGQIIIVFDTAFNHVGAQMTVTFQDYKVNGIKFEGTTTITRTGQYTFNQTTVDGKCTGSANNWTILWNCSRDFEWIAGQSQTGNNATDDVLKISGGGGGTDRNGRTFTVNITKPIIKSMGCRWIQEGTFELTPDGKPTRTVDFGNNQCDNKATITIEGNTFEFTMN